MREFLSYTIASPTLFEQKLLSFSRRTSVFFSFYSNGYSVDRTPYNEFDRIVGIESIESCSPHKDHLSQLNLFVERNKNDWLFGHISYDVKNEIESLKSGNKDNIGFEDLSFFRPEYVLLIKGNIVEIGILPGRKKKQDADALFNAINNSLFSDKKNSAIEFKAMFSKKEYIETVNEILHQIKRGNIYELNFCQEFYCKNIQISPETIFDKLNSISPTPFAVYYRNKHHYLLSASPERFLKKQENKLLSQPIKGTVARGINSKQDSILKNFLKNDPKERAENTMIVDLVRNDLTKIAQKGSVIVEEFCKIYTFPQVHQLISTVSCKLLENINFGDILKATFPMGSMTGAPKIRAMKLIELYERSKRGLFSGSVGYIAPNGNFDFNVIIRSLFYNESVNHLSFQVGSAITAQSIPEKEYEECLLKASAMIKIFEIV